MKTGETYPVLSVDEVMELRKLLAGKTEGEEYTEKKRAGFRDSGSFDGRIHLAYIEGETTTTLYIDTQLETAQGGHSLGALADSIIKIMKNGHDASNILASLGINPENQKRGNLELWCNQHGKEYAAGIRQHEPVFRLQLERSVGYDGGGLS